MAPCPPKIAATISNPKSPILPQFIPPIIAIINAILFSINSLLSLLPLVLTSVLNFIQSFRQNIIGDKMKRLILVFLSLFLCFLAVSARIIYINKDFSARVFGSFNSKSVEMANLRGTIFDCNKKRLTNEFYQKQVAVAPNAKAVNAVSKYLSENDRKTLANGFPIRVKVGENFSSKSVCTVLTPKRYSNVAAHIIGYCNAENNGVCGIEKAYNSVLKGHKIKVKFTCSAKGEVSGAGEVQGSPEYFGRGIMLTIDKKIQKICEKIAKKRLNAGAIIVIENKNGKLRALTSAPSFEQNDVEKSLDSPASPFLNRAIDNYNCGSIFKLCVAAASLYYNISLKYNCNGKIKIGNNTFKCLKKHKNTDLERAIASSCNCYFIKLGLAVGAKRLLNFAKLCGFGCDIKLCDGIVASSAFLPKINDLSNSPASLALFSFGQGSLLVSPLQIASLVQMIANNGKKITPSLVEGVTDYKGNLIKSSKQNSPTFVIDEKSAKIMQKCMISCVKCGTGTRARLKNGTAGGKTATAETGIFDKSGKAVKQTWFGGFFPAKNPKYSVVVLAENGDSGGKTAAPIFKEIAEQINSIKN